jgi:hypothetical protein
MRIRKEVSMPPLQTPSIEHEEFDRLCEAVDEFGPLSPPRREPPEETQQETPLDGQILAGLVSPV